jgi:hypothetical protein
VEVEALEDVAHGGREALDVGARLARMWSWSPNVLVVGQFGLRELARRALHGQRVGAARHRQHDVEGLAPLAGSASSSISVPP